MPYRLATPHCFCAAKGWLRDPGRTIFGLPGMNPPLGWMKGIEPSSAGATIRCVNRFATSTTHREYTIKTNPACQAYFGCQPTSSRLKAMRPDSRYRFKLLLVPKFWAKQPRPKARLQALEAPPRFELGVKDLQSSALPLGYGAR